jgi:hypothetical protein
LVDANDRLWTGLHPDAVAGVYGNHPAFETVQLEAAVSSRSKVLSSKDPLGAIQDAHWHIHQAHHDYQSAAEERRHLAADVGEATARMVDALVAAGWTEQQARNANVDELAREPAANHDAPVGEDLVLRECEGHPAGPFDPMGETVYRDGTCRR